MRLIYLQKLSQLSASHICQSWVPLSGTTTLLNVRNAFAGGSSYAPSGGSIQPGDQFMITEDSIQVVDLLIVSSSGWTFSSLST